MIKKTARQLIFFILFLFSFSAVFAKASDELYDVQIQKQDDNSGSFEDYYFLKTKGDVRKVDIEAELEIGKYRYRIGREGSEEDADFSDWFYFEIADESEKSGKGPGFDIYAGYIFPVIVFDDVIPDYMGQRYWPLSASAGLDFIPFKTRAGDFGIGLKGLYSRMEKSFSNYTISGNLLSIYFDLIYQIKLNRSGRCFLDIHGGAGLLYFLNFTIDYDNSVSTKSLNSLNMSFDAGLGINVLITKHLFARLNTDFTYSLMQDMTLGMVIPELSIGIRF